MLVQERLISEEKHAIRFWSSLNNENWYKLQIWVDNAREVWNSRALIKLGSEILRIYTALVPISEKINKVLVKIGVMEEIPTPSINKSEFKNVIRK